MLKTFNVLDPGFQVVGSYCLEASAGTGKTFAVEHLVVRLLLQEEVPMTLDQILVVTFTRAATRELRMRIRSNIEKAIHGLRSGQGFPYLTAYQGGIQKLQLALAAFEEAHILTIHGFCYRMLKEFAFEAHLSFNMSDPDDKTYKGLLRQEIRDFLRTGLREDVYGADVLDTIFKKYDGETLIEAIMRLVEGGGDFEGSELAHPLLQMARTCQKRWENQLAREIFSPDEILKKMKNCLERQAFHHKVSNRYQAVIIDEFQDTDPIQWHIFESLFVNKAPAIYLVGDPKQSIYAFRNADVYTYLKAADRMGEKCVLDTNFRSSPPLVDALNTFFASGSWFELPALNQVLPFYPVKAGRETHEGSLHFFVVEALATRERKWPSTLLEEEILFPFIACECEKWINRDVAVLVKDRYQAERLHHFLSRYQIPSTIKQGGDLRETAECAALEAILLAVHNPLDLSQLKEALGSCLIGWTAEALSSESKLQEAKCQFFDLKEVLNSTGFALFIQRFTEVFSIQWSQPLKQLVELLALEPNDPLQTMRDWKCSEEIIELRQEEQPGDIVIMTTHMSKGLEFDVVFALGLASRHLVKDEFVKTQGRMIPFDAEDIACRKAVNELDAEKLRQLYVALTRAKNHLYIPIIIDGGKKSEVYSPLELFLTKAIGFPLERQRITAFIEKIPNVQCTILDKKPEVKERPLKMHEEKAPMIIPNLPKGGTICSFSSIAQTSMGEKASPSASELPIGAETGTIVHRVFEKIFQHGWHHPFQKDQCLNLIQREIKGTSIEGWSSTLYEMVQRALHTSLENCVLADIHPNNIMQEMEFLFPAGEHLIKGFADLCFAWRGKYYLLDWKTNWLPDYSEASLEQAMHQHDYFLQASLYTEALKRYVKLFDTAWEFGGAYYYFLRGPAVYHFFPRDLGTKI